MRREKVFRISLLKKKKEQIEVETVGNRQKEWLDTIFLKNKNELRERKRQNESEKCVKNIAMEKI